MMVSYYNDGLLLDVCYHVCVYYVILCVLLCIYFFYYVQTERGSVSVSVCVSVYLELDVGQVVP